MDDAMMSRLMQSYGAANNAANANRVREFAASNPEVLEHRAMGMRGSLREDNSDLLGPLLEKLMAETDNAPPGRVEVGAPEVQQTMPTVQAASAPTRKSATAAPTPQMGPNLPMAQGAVNPLDSPAKPTTSREGGVWDWLLPVLIGVGGMGAADQYMKRKKPSGPSDANTLTPDPVNTPPNAAKMKAQPRAIDNNGQIIEDAFPTGKTSPVRPPALTDQSGKKMPSGAPELDKQGIETERRKMLQAEIDAENAELARNSKLQEQMRIRAAEEAETAKLSKKSPSARDVGKKAQSALGRK